MHGIARRSRPLALAAALLGLACSDSTSPESALTAEEANELAFQLGALFSADFATVSASATQSAARTSAIPQPIDIEVDFSVPCPHGGNTQLTAKLSGTIDPDADLPTADINVTARNRPSNCGLDVHGKIFRVTGELTATAHAKIEDGTPVGEHTATLQGSFRWRTDRGRHGSCTVSYSASANYTTNVSVVNGNFCGTTINVTGPIGFGPVGGI